MSTPTVEASPAGAVRERAVPCNTCGRDTWNFSGRCVGCQRAATERLRRLTDDGEHDNADSWVADQ